MHHQIQVALNFWAPFQDLWQTSRKEIIDPAQNLNLDLKIYVKGKKLTHIYNSRGGSSDGKHTGIHLKWSAIQLSNYPKEKKLKKLHHRK